MEKPLTTSAADARTLLDAGGNAGVLVMEAMWSRYLPQASVIRTLLADGALGEVRAVSADHGQAITPDSSNRHFRPELGGGALLDLGIYPVQFASMALGVPDQVTARGGLTDTGVDAYSTLVLDYDDGAQGVVTSSLTTRTHTTASIAGTKAALLLASPFYNPTSFRLSSVDYFAPPVDWSDPTPLRGFDALSWEATALAQFVGEGRLESPVHDHDETVAILNMIDQARAQLGAVQNVDVTA